MMSNDRGFDIIELEPDDEASWNRIISKAFPVLLASKSFNSETAIESYVIWVDTKTRLDFEFIREQLSIANLAASSNLPVYQRDWDIRVSPNLAESDYAHLLLKLGPPINEELGLLFQFPRHSQFLRDLQTQQNFLISTEPPGIMTRLLTVPVPNLISDKALLYALDISAAKAAVRRVQGLPMPGHEEAMRVSQEAARRVKEQDPDNKVVIPTTATYQEINKDYERMKLNARQRNKANFS